MNYILLINNKKQIIKNYKIEILEAFTSYILRYFNILRFEILF